MSVVAQAPVAFTDAEKDSEGPILYTFHILRMRGSVLAYASAGNEDRPMSNFADLALAMAAPQGSTTKEVHGSTLYGGDGTDNASETLARRLAAKHKEHVFVSMDVSTLPEGHTRDAALNRLQIGVARRVAKIFANAA